MRLIEKVWFENHKAKFVLVPLLLPFSALFYLISSIRKLGFKLNLFKTYKAQVPVIIVGNIGVGGNGKTPLVLYLVEQLSQQGFNVGVISRGYGGKAPSYPYLLTQHSQVDYSGDEPFLIYQRTKVPVCVGAERSHSIEVLKQQGCDLIIADDGMQHYQLSRDIEIAVIDGNRRFGNGLLLPAGPLRELPSRLTTVDFVVCNSGQAQTGEVLMTLAPSKFINISTGEQLTVTEFVNKFPRVNAIAGIGAPSRFFDTLTSLGVELDHQQGFVDHHHYSSHELTSFCHAEIPLVMTEKDAVKCQNFNLANAWFLPVDAQLPDQFKQALLAKLT